MGDVIRAPKNNREDKRVTRQDIEEMNARLTSGDDITDKKRATSKARNLSKTSKKVVDLSDGETNGD